VLNSPGTIDRGYTGEIKVILFNQSQEPYLVKRGQKIAQLVIVPVLHPYIEVVKERLQITTSRGDKGFGSTGV
jgi:dUTP pyrophosphatase